MEEQLSFEAEGRTLYGVLHVPEQAPCRAGIVVCAPFAEEKKCAYRAFVEFAREAASRRYAVLRFDYGGTGDSAGPFQTFSLAAAGKEARVALDLLKERVSAPKLGLLGLRLGGAIALAAAEQCEEPAFLILWQPIADGASFFRLNLRRQLVRQMLTRGKAKEAQADGSAPLPPDTVDLDGYLVSKDTCDEIKAVNLTESNAPLPWPTLLAQISHSQELADEYRPLAERIGAPGAAPALVHEPIWNRIGYVNSAPLIGVTLDWLDTVVDEAG